jgi:hypothetical protein
MRKLLFLIFIAAAAYGDTPETVFITYYPKPGKDAEMLRILKDEWNALTKLSLVTGGHQLYRAESESGKSFFVEIFTWKGHEIPDHAPPEVRKVWAEMHANVEKLEFFEITPISVESSPPAAAPSK